MNIVHLDDCIGGVLCVLLSKHTSRSYNLCAPQHPRRQDFYTKAAQLLSLVAPDFSGETQLGKVIDGSKITTELGFEYRYKDPMDMLFAC